MMNDHRLVLTATVAGQPFSRTLTAADPFVTRQTVLGPERTTAIDLGPLHVIVCVRDQRYRSDKPCGARLDLAVESPWVGARDVITYDFAADLTSPGGYYMGEGPLDASTKRLIDAKGLAHVRGQRWRWKTWIGKPGREWVFPDRLALQASGMLPNYRHEGLALPVLNGIAAADPWTFPIAPWTAFEGETGGRPEIALLPAWDVRALVDETFVPDALLAADRYGCFGTHYRSQQTGKPLTIAEAPDLVIAEALSATNFDVAHHPGAAWVPFLLCGDRYYAEEVAFLANFMMLNRRADYRQRDKGVMIGHSQVRGEAWAMRSLMIASMLPEDVVG